MKIAYFSPLLPHPTGVAVYSEHLLPYLREQAEVSLFSAEYPSALSRERQVHDLRRHPEAVLGLDRHDAVVYQLGNHPGFHLDLYRALLRRRGVVVLHDTVLYFLSAGQGIGGLMKDLALDHGAACVERVREIVAASPDGDPLRYPHPGRFPLIRRPVEAATQVIVHSRHAARTVERLGVGRPVHVIPHLIYPGVDTAERAAAAQALRTRLGLAPGQLLFTSLGFVGPTKRLPSILRALAELPARLDFKFVIVGQGGQELLGLARSLGLGERVAATDFVPEDEFPTYIAASDVVVNLRHPSMGETSGTVSQAMFLRRPCVVTDDAWFSELPDDAVVKVGIQNEVQEVRDALIALAGNSDLRHRMGDAARTWIELTAHPRVVARQYSSVLRAEQVPERAAAEVAVHEAQGIRRSARARPRRKAARQG